MLYASVDPQTMDNIQRKQIQQIGLMKKKVKNTTLIRNTIRNTPHLLGPEDVNILLEYTIFIGHKVTSYSKFLEIF